MIYLTIHTNYSIWFIVAGFILGFLIRFIINIFKNKPINISEDEIKEYIKNRINYIVENGRGRAVKAINNGDSIHIKLEAPDTIPVDINLNKITKIMTFDRDPDNLTIQLSDEEYDKFYNSIYFYIV